MLQEFYLKCRSSQELIFAQIPWASAGADRSRDQIRTRHLSHSEDHDISSSDDSPVEQTVEEQLLAALLAANEQLLEALRVYEDLERVAMERKAEDRSRRDVRMDRQVQWTQMISVILFIDVRIAITIR